VRFFSGTFYPPLELLRNSFIAAVKTSHTTGTLCETFCTPLLTTLKDGCNMKNATKNLNEFGHGGIRAAASQGKKDLTKKYKMVL
jgi:hypothetical protein